MALSKNDRRRMDAVLASHRPLTVNEALCFEMMAILLREIDRLTLVVAGYSAPAMPVRLTVVHKDTEAADGAE